MNQKFLIPIVVLIIVVLIIIWVGFLKAKKNKQLPQMYPPVVEEKTPITPAPIPLTTSTIKVTTPTFPTEIPSATITKKYRLLFKESFLYIDLQYPLLYVYDPQQGIIKYLNLEDETYKEIAKIPNILSINLSSDKNKMVLKTTEGFSILDLKSDKLYKLPSVLIDKIITDTDLIVYINDNKTTSYLAYFKDNKFTKIRDIGLLNPEFALTQNGLLIYEKNTPILLLSLKPPYVLSLFLQAEEVAGILPNKNKDLILVSYKQNSIWQNDIMDLKKTKRYSFPWVTIKDKCTFEDVLVCAVVKNFDLSLNENWNLGETAYDEKIVIYDPKSKQLKEINLENNFDFVKPKLTPLGIIAWNRIDGKLYLLKLD